MASSPELAQYIAEQFSEAGHITWLKMFGEFGIYCDGKIFALVCDDRLFIKITEAGRRVCPGLPEEPPYQGAKNYFLVEDFENVELMTKLAIETCRELPPPKPKKKKAIS